MYEALRLAKCHHPRIVQVYEVVEHQGLMGMVMEYIQGQNLAELVEENGPMSRDQTLKIMEQIGATLTLVHSQELLHRDIKPNNIMLRPDGNAVCRGINAGEPASPLMVKPLNPAKSNAFDNPCRFWL